MMMVTQILVAIPSIERLVAWVKESLHGAARKWLSERHWSTRLTIAAIVLAVCLRLELGIWAAVTGLEVAAAWDSIATGLAMAAGSHKFHDLLDIVTDIRAERRGYKDV